MDEDCLAHQRLRRDTAEDHAVIDAAFSRFRLDDPQAYGDFLTAHARCVLPLEQALGHQLWAEWTPRGDLLRADLAALGRELLDPLEPPVLSGPEARWGACYVLEGSRLGGAMLRRQVGGRLPSAYLSAVHPSGRWRRFLETLDAALADDCAQTVAVGAARAVFAMFGRSVALEPVRA